jgi:hypothetical protein
MRPTTSEADMRGSSESQISFEKTDDRRQALKGADYVINTAFGGYDYTEKMRRLGEKHGYYRGIDAVEFNFVSDYYTILSFRQYQLALDIAADMEEICPDALDVPGRQPDLRGYHPASKGRGARSRPWASAMGTLAYIVSCSRSA